MKKTICKIMSFIMMISAVSVVNTTAVSAAVAFDHVSNSAMRPNGETDSASAVPGSENQVFLQFDVPAVGQMHMLKYAYEDGKVIIAEFTSPANNEVNVNYYIEDSSGARIQITNVPTDPADPVDGIWDIDGTTLRAPTETAHTLLEWTGDYGFTNFNTLLNRALYFSLPYTNTTTSETHNYMSFTLKDITDATKVLDTVIVKIVGTKIHYAASNALQGSKIYPFLLSNGTDVKHYNISTGYGDAVQFVPPNVNSRIINVSGGDSLEPPELKFTFPLPSVWDNTSKRFVPLNQINTATMDFSHIAGGDFDANNLMFRLSMDNNEFPELKNSFLNPLSNAQQTDKPANAPSAVYDYRLVSGSNYELIVKEDPNEIDITKNAIKYSTIYSNMRFVMIYERDTTAADASDLKVDKISELGPAYTTLKYIIRNEGLLRVDITQYQYYEFPTIGSVKPVIPGMYYLHRNDWEPSDRANFPVRNFLNDPPTTDHTAGTLMINAPAESDSDVLNLTPSGIFNEGAPYHYRIVFEPDNYSTFLLPNEIRSYIYRYIIGPPDSITVPGNLKILPTPMEERPDVNNPRQPYTITVNGDNYLRLGFSFNTGDHQAFEKMAQEGITEVRYILSSSLSPAGNKTEFLRLRVALNTADPSDPVGEITLIGTDGRILVEAAYDRSRETITADVLLPLSDTAQAGYLTCPSLYYLAVMGSSDKGNTDYSNIVLLNVNRPTTQEIPMPNGFKIADGSTGINEFSFSWDLSLRSMFNYMELMLHPKKLTLDDDSVSFSIYLGSNSDNYDKFINELNETGAVIADVEDDNDVIDVLFSSIKSANDIDLTTLNAGLRNGAIYKITGIPLEHFAETFRTDDTYRNRVFGGAGLSRLLEIKFVNADENYPYFATAVTNVKLHETNWRNNDLDIGLVDYVDDTDSSGNITKEPFTGAATGDILQSIVSSVVSVTTKTSPEEPVPEDFQPPAPTYVEVTARSRQVDLLWILNGIVPEETKPNIKYEIVRTNGVRLGTDFIKDKDHLSNIIPSHENEEYDFTSWKEYESPHTNMDIGLNSDDVHYAINTELSTNTLYFYYVRTVLLDSVTKQPIQYSEWVETTATTLPLDRPENLVSAQDGDFNHYTEALLQFDAPATFEQIFVTRKYGIELSYKKDDGPWSNPVEILAPELTGGTVKSDDRDLAAIGYFKYEYKMTGLTTASSYVVRIRMIEVATDGTEYLSMWSDAVSIRTEFDPSIPPDEGEKWIDYYERKLEELLKRPYWPIRKDTSTTLEAVYRYSMIDGVIGAAQDKMILLDGAGRAAQTYFIPVEAVKKTDLSSTGYKIIADNVTVLIPHDVINSQSTAAIRDINNQLSAGKIRDYYLQLSVHLTPTRELVNGSNAMTDRITFTIKTVGFDQYEKIWDVEVADTFKKMMADGRASTLRKINTELDKNITDAQMVLYIDRLVSDFEQDFIVYARKSFTDRRIYEYEAETFNKPATIIGFPKPASAPGTTSQPLISGFRFFSAGWQSLQTSPYLNGGSMLTQSPGIFIFARRNINIPGVNEMQNNNAIVNAAAKYGLDEFFSEGTIIGVHAPLTNGALTGSIARLAGATKTQDSVTYLRDRGIRATIRNMDQGATNETAIYMIMSLYEIKTKTKLTSIRITNHNIINGIDGINAAYVPAYKAAYTIGLIDKPMMPKQTMTVKDFLEIIGKLSSKVSL